MKHTVTPRAIDATPPGLGRLALASVFAISMLVAGTSARALAPQKSPNDSRAYEHFVLDNGLKVLVVSDPRTDKAAASLDVDVGSGDDPPGREGLAHFLEHMLFLGTEKYPRPGEYKDFIAAHGGGNNAYTSFGHTNYFFDVDEAHLEPALDRFAQFFVAPVLNGEYVAREREVVHSEYTSKLESDGRRIYYAAKQAMNPAHPAARFSVGSRETLADREGEPVRAALLRFYEQYYSARRMALVVLGREPTEVLRRWVAERFSGVPDRGRARAPVREPLYRPESLPALLHVKPYKERRSLSLTFPIPPIEPHFRTKPIRLIGDLLGHEGVGSLLSLLKARGWAEGLSAGAGFSNADSATFEVSVRLTREGLEHVDAIAALVFRYLDRIRAEGVEPWRYAELARLLAIRFRFEERAEPLAHARRLASDLHTLPPEEILRGHYLMEGFDAALIREYLDLLVPERALVTVVAKDLPTDRRTDWFDVPYALTPLAPETIAAWRASEAPGELSLPPPNEFIPEALALAPAQGASAVPVRLAKTGRFELWHQQDTTFGLPRSDFYFTVRSALANDTPRHALLTQLYTRLVNDQLDEYAYPAALAGLGYRLYKHVRGFSVRLSGYSSKQEVLVGRIVAALARPRLRADRFEVIKESMTRRLRNALEDAPYRRALDKVRQLVMDRQWTEAERLQAIEGLTLADLEAFIPRLLEDVEVVALAHGNLRPDAALALAEPLRRTLAGGDEAAPATTRPGVIRLEAGTRFLGQLQSNHADSALVAYFQGGSRSFEERAGHLLLAQVIGPSFFEVLRTERKLGYVVFASPMPFVQVPGLVFVVQSPDTPPYALDGQVDAFLRDHESVIAAMESAELERHKTALASRILERESQLGDRSDRYWNEIDRERYAFDTRERLVEALEAIDLDAFRALYRRAYLGPETRRLAVRVTGASATADVPDPAVGTRLVTEQTDFGSARERFPEPGPAAKLAQPTG
jgi:secreted Zn-dependent insulinase-like peptidase